MGSHTEETFIIPLIDFAPFITSTPEDRKATARAILQGFRTAGFIYLRNLPIPPHQRAAAFAASASYFSLPQQTKQTHTMPSVESNRGYAAQGLEKLSPFAADLKETLHTGREDDPAHPNIWPEDSEVLGFRKEVSSFFETCAAASVQVMRAIAVGLDIDEAYFDTYMERGDHKLRLLHYPETRKDVFTLEPRAVRAGEHTDYGAITLLFQDGSTAHRVVQPPMQTEGEVWPARYSIAFFANSNENSFIEVIPGTVRSESGKKYEGIMSGEYYLQRLRSTH
ncbi:hypothetical protein BDW74DRAFT_176042 [Aspergillus multicolor]|uniref:uncharacterized protein n=1 Tax=Aspergillus multicolor TaxID=41759 RepID=UPI003CCCD31F